MSKYTITIDSLWQDILKIRHEAPLVHNITNYVVMNTTANALLALGASPVMAHAIEEVEEMVDLARSLVLNMGTLSPSWVEAMLTAGSRAKGRGTPIVFDPVGTGATSYRTATARRILSEVNPDVIRANASEILSLAYSVRGTKGVDSTHAPEETLDAARALAVDWHCVVTVSGPADMIVSADTMIQVLNGHPMMPRVTGLGCTATAVKGAFAAVNPDPLAAAVDAMALMGIAGEIAGEKSPGPGSFQLQFLDALHLVCESDIRERLNVHLEGP